MTETGKDKSAADNALPARVSDVLRQPKRLEALEILGLSSPGHEQMFDDLVRRAAELFDAPIAMVTLVGEERQWIKSSKGFDALETPTETSFCVHAIAEEEPALIILDTKTDSRFSENPHVTGGLKIRFYMGCPIRFLDQKVGTLCVYDIKPREKITPEQKRLLLDLSWNASQILGASE